MNVLIRNILVSPIFFSPPPTNESGDPWFLRFLSMKSAMDRVAGFVGGVVESFIRRHDVWKRAFAELSINHGDLVSFSPCFRSGGNKSLSETIFQLGGRVSFREDLVTVFIVFFHRTPIEDVYDVAQGVFSAHPPFPENEIFLLLYLSEKEGGDGEPTPMLITKDSFQKYSPPIGDISLFTQPVTGAVIPKLVIPRLDSFLGSVFLSEALTALHHGGEEHTVVGQN